MRKEFPTSLLLAASLKIFHFTRYQPPLAILLSSTLSSIASRGVPLSYFGFPSPFLSRPERAWGEWIHGKYRSEFWYQKINYYDSQQLQFVLIVLLKTIGSSVHRPISILDKQSHSSYTALLVTL